MEDETKKQLIKYLKYAEVTRECPRCSSDKFEIVESTNIELSRSRVMPACLVLCSRCGFITMHSIGVLTSNYMSGSF